MAKEKYLRLDPDGGLSWITIDRDRFLVDLCKALDCDSLEHLNLKYDLECLVDCFGAFSSHQHVNTSASRLCSGFRDEMIFGPVIFCRTYMFSSGVFELRPLLPGQIRVLEHRLNVDIPDPED